MRKPALLILLCFVMCPPAHAATLQAMKVDILAGDYAGAVDKGNSMISRGQVFGSKDEVRYLLGISYLKTGNAAAAIRLFEQVVSDSRRGAFRELSYLGLADAYEQQGEAAKSEKWCRDFISLFPRSKYRASAEYRLSQIKLQVGAPAQSVSALEHIGRTYPLLPEYAARKEECALPAAPAGGKDGPVFSVQVGAFSREENARSLMSDLSVRGYPAYTETISDAGKITYRVRVGKSRDFAEVRALEQKLTDEGYPTKLCP